MTLVYVWFLKDRFLGFLQPDPPDPHFRIRVLTVIVILLLVWDVVRFILDSCRGK